MTYMAHHFKPMLSQPLVCVLCGREANDYGYHFKSGIEEGCSCGRVPHLINCQLVAPTSAENSKAEAFFAGFDKQSFKIDPIGPTAELTAENDSLRQALEKATNLADSLKRKLGQYENENERLSIKGTAAALRVQQLYELLDTKNSELSRALDEVERLREFEFMYKDLCK